MARPNCKPSSSSHERLRLLLIHQLHQLNPGEFNIYRLMAEKAMHDRDYRAQLERSAYGHDKPKELSELNAGIEKGMAVLRQKHMNDEEEYRREVCKVNGVRDMVTWCRMDEKGKMAGFRETNANHTDELKGQCIFSVSQQACWGAIS